MRVFGEPNLEWCGIEDVDSTPSNFSVTNLDIFGLIYSIIAHLVDAGLDIYLAVFYFNNSNYDYFFWTVLFIVVPAVINTCVSLAMYAEDAKNLNILRPTPCMLLRKSETRCLGTFQILMHILQLSTTLRCCDSLKFALASRQAERRNDRKEQKLQYENMLKEDSDISLLRLIECFLESAPQLALQLTIVLRNNGDWKTLQIVSIISSFLGIVWSIAGYHRAIRFAQSDKSNITWCGTSIQFIWHLCVTLSRVLSLSAAATIFPQWTMVGCLIHCGIMTLWVFYLERSPFCANTLIHSFLFSGVLGLVYLFTYIMPHDGKTAKKYSFYYSTCFIEVIICVTIYALYLEENMQKSHYYYSIIGISIIPYILGIGFMILYYSKFHPRRLNVGA